MGLQGTPDVQQQMTFALGRQGPRIRKLSLHIGQCASKANSAAAMDLALVSSGERSHASASWDGSGSQEDLMRKDQCITVDESDNILGSGSKYEVHRFNSSQPKGVLHRAFSVFLFDSQDRLLLQQRAASKITFPSVWTNTCCSHPLAGQDPGEVDKTEDVAQGIAKGAKAAAIRKLNHELGIAVDSLSISDFRYLTRLHYCASDSITYGPNAEWGEHEMDYILFAKKDVGLNPNTDEVQDTRFVTQSQLKEMMDPENGLLWSPWFRIIAKNFLGQWWGDLDATLRTDDLSDWKTVHSILEP